MNGQTISSNLAMISTTSLVSTLEEINLAKLFDREPTKKAIKRIFEIVETRQIESGDEEGAIALTTRDYYHGKNLFTGEKLQTDLATNYIINQEIARVLLTKEATLKEELLTKQEALISWLEQACFAEFCAVGECKHASIGYMRFLAVASEDKEAQRKLESYLELLHEYRDKKGSWTGFPFYYTILMLSEVQSEIAIKELQYSLPAFERRMKRYNSRKKAFERRKKLYNKVLERCYQLF